MKVSLLAFIYLCCLYGVLKTDAFCPTGQCVCAETFMICRASDVNSATPLDVTADLNKIVELPNKMLPPNLTEILFANSPLQIIGDSAFDESASTLITITFTSCLITKIPDTFLNLKALKYLTIIDTKIQEWNSAAMINIGRTVESVFFSNVGFSNWPSWLSNFTSVVEFTFEMSNVTSIPDETFELMSTSLTSLSITTCKLTAVPKAVSRLFNLHVLDLSQNLISNLTWLPQSKVLTNLIFNTNSISDSIHLSNSLLPFSNNLSVLDLHGNKLTSIPKLYFLTNVQTLDMSNNRLSDVISGSLPPGMNSVNLENNLFRYVPLVMATSKSLTIMDMSFNVVTLISATDFSQSITAVDLDNNQLTELNEGCFPVNSNIELINLNNNPITTITPTAFANLAGLTSLSLTNSRLTRVPVALVALKNLEWLDLTGSNNLVCTCTEKTLEVWITSRTPEEVLGDCGLTSIHTFFTKLSPNCPG